MEIVFDLEGDGLLDEITKIHCLSYSVDGGPVETLTDYNAMRELVISAKILVGHNIVTFDIPVIEKILGVKVEAELIDTLPLSWYLNTKRVLHGLDSFHEDFGIAKPKIDNWKNLSLEEYVHRCTEDVKITNCLWRDLQRKLSAIYNDPKQERKLIRYLSFKMDCIREQEKSRWTLDKPKVKRYIHTLEQQQEEKVAELIGVMPKRKVYVEKTRPTKPFKKDGTWSVTGANWFNLLAQKNLPEDFNGSVKVLLREEDANPNSSQQVKDWLYSLGWKPCTYKFDRNKTTGEEKQIEQIRKDGELTPSVINLIDKEPVVEVLEGLTIIQHRLSIFKGYRTHCKDGHLIAGVGGLTNTLRFKHRAPLVNLPGVDKPWGKEIRGVLIAPEGHLLCGSDMVSLEDNTKRHYMFAYDPKYVEEMSRDGFDPHLDLAIFAGATTQQEIDDWQNEVEGARELKGLRKGFKVTNYSATYGVMAKKLARETGLSVSDAQKLLDAFWERNWAILKVVEATKVITVDGQMWLLNPVSGFYYSLRNKKDIFSTLNQGTGVYCFDCWIKEWRKVRPQLTAQFHDEIIACLKPQFKERYTRLLKEAIGRVNDKLKLNVELDVDVQFGETYADIH